MRVLMLGWEFPPYITGGLGVACHGLTRGLSRQGVDVLFALPKPRDREQPAPPTRATRRGRRAAMAFVDVPPPQQPAPIRGVEFRQIPGLSGASPYDRPADVPLTRVGRERAAMEVADAWGRLREPAPGEPDNPHAAPLDAPAPAPAPPAAAQANLLPLPGVGRYEGDLLAEAQRYADWCMQLLAHEDVDLIHAHDWLTFPAALTLARQMRKPLVVHIHSTEHDRAGPALDERIVEIERQGMMGAMTVICVSHLTRTICEQRYGVPAGKIQVVYNGIDADGPPPPDAIHKDEQVVLFLGRITLQKGPEYFLEAARRVLQKLPAVKFVMAGAGDLADRVYRRAAQLGISDRVVFTGFLRPDDVPRVFAMADVYVMPSVSEPFGIAPLEAIRADVPVIISRTSGVAEVLNHVLKVDFWDTADMAEKIIAVLRHPPLGQTLREHAEVEVRQLTWDGAASRCKQIYQRAIAGSGGTVSVLD